MLTNNDILKKLRVALKLRDDDVIHILSLVDFKITKGEVGALYRSPDHPNFKECGDQLLRNFLNGLIIHLRGPMENQESLQEFNEEKIVKKSDQKERTKLNIKLNQKPEVRQSRPRISKSSPNRDQ